MGSTLALYLATVTPLHPHLFSILCFWGLGSANHILLFQLLCMDYRETRGRPEWGENLFLLKWLLLSSASSEEWHLAPVAAPLRPLITRRLCPSGGSNAPAGVPLRELSASSIGARLHVSGLKNPTFLCVSTPVNRAASCNYYHERTSMLPFASQGSHIGVTPSPC